jgi:hypothetical protein
VKRNPYAEPAVGRASVRDAVAGFFSGIDGLTHHILNSKAISCATGRSTSM